MKKFFASKLVFAAVLALFVFALTWNAANGAQAFPVLKVAHGPILCDSCEQVAHGPILCDSCAQVAHGPILCDSCVQARPEPSFAVVAVATTPIA